MSTDHSPESRLLLALRHPLRRDILRIMVGEEEISPQELSARLKRSLTDVSYHVRVLVDCEAITLVRTEPVRGSIKHLYRFSIETGWACESLGLSPPLAPPSVS